MEIYLILGLEIYLLIIRFGDLLNIRFGDLITYLEIYLLILRFQIPDSRLQPAFPNCNPRDSGFQHSFPSCNPRLQAAPSITKHPHFRLQPALPSCNPRDFGFQRRSRATARDFTLRQELPSLQTPNFYQRLRTATYVSGNSESSYFQSSWQLTYLLLSRGEFTYLF